jgi:hypothetical protein
VLPRFAKTHFRPLPCNNYYYKKKTKSILTSLRITPLDIQGNGDIPPRILNLISVQILKSIETVERCKDNIKMNHVTRVETIGELS